MPDIPGTPSLPVLPNWRLRVGRPTHNEDMHFPKTFHSPHAPNAGGMLRLFSLLMRSAHTIFALCRENHQTFDISQARVWWCPKLPEKFLSNVDISDTPDEKVGPLTNPLISPKFDGVVV